MSTDPKNQNDQQRTILVVDDFEDTRLLLRSWLRKKGYRVVEAENGNEAIAKAREIAPDLIIMDVEMPELDGLSATRQIRVLKDSAELPIVAVSAYGADQFREQALAAGCNEYVSTPFEPDELEKLILYVGEKKKVGLGDVETMVLSAKQRSLYELTDAISSKNRVRALEILDAMLSTGDGEEAAIGHLYMLAKTFRQMLVILERNVRDQRMLWAALWQGFRVPPFAADDIIRQSHRYKSKRELTRAIRLVAKADLALRSNPPGKRLILEKLVLDLCAEVKVESAGGWMQEELPV